MGKAEGRRSKGREKRRIERKNRKRGSKESGRGMGDMRRERRSSKVRRESEETSAREVSQIDKGVWEETVRKYADEESVGPCNRSEGGVRTTKRKGIPTVERRERGGKRVCKRTVAKRIHPTVKVTANGAGILCGKERWEEMNGAGLQISE